MIRGSTWALVAVAVLLSSPLSAQQRQQPSYKEPGTAMMAGILVPGGGQLYAGETDKGLKLLGIGGGGGLILTAAGVSSGNTGLITAGSLVYLGAVVYGVLDADDSARRMNEKHGFRTALPTISPDRSGGVAVGLSLKL